MSRPTGYLSQEELEKSTMTTEPDTDTLPLNRINGVVDNSIQSNIINAGKINTDPRFPLNGGVLFDKPKVVPGRKGKKKDKDDEEDDDDEYVGVEEGDDDYGKVGDGDDEEIEYGETPVRGPTDDEDLNEGSGRTVEDNEEEEPKLAARD